ncbi:hypothetical protein [Adhaeribacter radiodurans]|nr:hypothetical protein [Adhaeribacter radiodurans]
MKTITITSLLIIGTLGLVIKSLIDAEDIHINLTDEDYHLYL